MVDDIGDFPNDLSQSAIVLGPSSTVNKTDYSPKPVKLNLKIKSNITNTHNPAAKYIAKKKDSIYNG